MSKKRKLNYKNIFLFIILIILIIVLIILSIPSNKYSDKKEEKEKQEEIKEKELTEEEKKLIELNNIDKQLDFFKYEKIDRYLEYKKIHPEFTNEQIIVYVNIGLDNPFYTNILDSPYKYENTVLSNKYYNLGSDYVPKDLTLIDSKYSSGDRYMTKEAVNAFNELAKDAKAQGYNIRAVSTYRSYDYQTNLYNKYAANDGKEKADTYSARAGFSEHQTGLAVDVDNINQTYTNFKNTKEYNWMKENCYKYGFILRYEEENEWITGYMKEEWHYRYVGKEIAKYIHDNPMTYEEYYVRFLDK